MSARLEDPAHYRVHIYAVVRVPYDVKANSAKAAAKEAQRLATEDNRRCLDVACRSSGEYAGDYQDSVIIDLLDANKQMVASWNYDLELDDSPKKTCGTREEQNANS